MSRSGRKVWSSGREIGRVFGHQQLSSVLWGKVIFSLSRSIMVRRCGDTDLSIVRVPGELARPKWFERGLRVCMCGWVGERVCIVLCSSIVQLRRRLCAVRDNPPLSSSPRSDRLVL